MCGIVGRINFNNQVIENRKDIDIMLDSARHRGPDDCGICGVGVDGRSLYLQRDTNRLCDVIGILGFNRLSIRDLSMNGHQPMVSKDGDVVITFNGEIYNSSEYKKKLIKKGYEFISNTDTEVILYMYYEYGFEESIKRLNGMFAIVIYDCRIKKLFLARDRLGIIPLYYYANKNFISWASEIKCFRDVSFYAPRINLFDVTMEFMYCFPSVPIYEDIKVFEPGTIKVVDVGNGKIESTVYFEQNSYEKIYISYDEALKRAEEILKRVVKRQLIADCPLGVQFSGGIDSTLIAANASELFQKKKKMLHGFSLINTTSSEHDESKYIYYAAEKIAIGLHVVDMDADRFIDDLEICTFALERPINDPSPLGIYEFSKMASKEVKVLLSGEGADELCGGYLDFGRYLDSVSDLESDEFVLKFNQQISEERVKSILLTDKVDEVKQFRQKEWNSYSGSAFDRLRKFYFHSLLQGMLERQNKVCMFNSVENRVPFLDNEFVDLMMAIPDNYLASYVQKFYEGKYLLKNMSERIFGPEFAYRKKQFIRVPIMDYMRTNRFQKYVKSTIIPPMKRRGIINYEEFINIYENLDMNNVMSAWKAINFELWCQLFIDKRNPRIID